MSNKNVTNVQTGLTTVAALTTPEENEYTAFQAVAGPEASRVAAIDAAIVGDTTISQLRGLNNTAFDQWFDDNITTLPQARVVLRRLAKLVFMLLRRSNN